MGLIPTFGVVVFLLMLLMWLLPLTGTLIYTLISLFKR